MAGGTKDGFVRYVLQRILESHDIVASADIISEYERVARYPKFSPHTAAYMLKSIAAIEACARLVDPFPSKITCPDPEDIAYIEAAVAGAADFLITGNLKHFPDSPYGTARVVTVREFADLAGLIP